MESLKEFRTALAATIHTESINKTGVQLIKLATIEPYEEE